MAIFMTKNENYTQTGVYKFVADSEADIQDIPKDVAPGSRIFCIENSKVFVLSTSFEWIEIKSGSEWHF